MILFFITSINHELRLLILSYIETIKILKNKLLLLLIN